MGMLPLYLVIGMLGLVDCVEYLPLKVARLSNYSRNTSMMSFSLMNFQIVNHMSQNLIMSRDAGFPISNMNTILLKSVMNVKKTLSKMSATGQSIGRKSKVDID